MKLIKEKQNKRYLIAQQLYFNMSKERKIDYIDLRFNDYIIKYLGDNKWGDDVIRKVALDIGNNSIKLLIGEMSSDFTKIAITDYVKVKHVGLRKSENLWYKML